MAPDYAARPANPDRLAALREHAVGSLLDVGCGNGVYLDSAAGTAVGLDMTAPSVWVPARGSFVIGDATALPFPDRSFDTVSCFETLEHVPDVGAAIGELARVARRTVIVSVPNCAEFPAMAASNLVFGHWTDRTHVNFFSADRLRQALETGGFSNVRVSAINRIDPAPFVLDALRVPRPVRPIAARLARRLADYRMTLLAIGDAPTAPRSA